MLNYEIFKKMTLVLCKCHFFLLNKKEVKYAKSRIRNNRPSDSK